MADRNSPQTIRNCWPKATIGVPGLSARRRGLTLVEVVVASTILVIGMLALTSTVWHVHALVMSNQERRAAENEIRSVIEQIHSASFAALDDPDAWAQSLTADFSPNGNPGDTFGQANLEPAPGAASLGTIQIITNEMTTDAQLGLELGMPRDLDGDGLIDNNDVTATAAILPVVVRLQWAGSSGSREIVHGFFLTGY